MHGFIVIVSDNDLVSDYSFCWKDKFEFQNEQIKTSASGKNFKAERYGNSKFSEQKIWLDDTDIFVVTEGIINNLTDLKIQHQVENDIDLFKELLKSPKKLNTLSGNYCGLMLNKKNNEIVAFNNHSASKKLFYYFDKHYSIFSTDLYTLSKSLDHFSLQKTLNIEASYLLLSSGFMHGNITLINELKQVRAGEYIRISKQKLTSDYYFHLQNVETSKDDSVEIIEQLELYFKKALKKEFEIDRRAGLTPLVTLSGGLDSRMTALCAFKLGYENQHLINFSEKGYADHIIASQIAGQYGLDFQHISLTANTLNLIDESVSVNDGLTLYLSSNLIFDVLPTINMQNKGTLHTGILGDALLGSYLKSVQPSKAAVKDGNYSNYLFEKVKNTIQSSINLYENEELYKFYNRGFLGINNGFLYYDLITETSSPFLDPEFMKLAISIPRELRYKQKIYIDWIKAKHPDIARYTWENIGGKPTNNEFLRQYYRYKRSLMKRLPVKNMWKNNMTPEQMWYTKNEDIQEYMKSYFYDHIDLVDFNTELRNDLLSLFTSRGVTEKTQALTFLSAYKLLFVE